MSSSQIEIKKARRSGLIAALIFSIIGSLQLWKQHMGLSVTAYSISVTFFVLAGFFPKIFIKVTHAIGEFITKGLLCIVFYLVVMPIGLLMRVFGKDHLDKAINKKQSSYWVKKEPNAEGIKAYERQF